MCLQMVSVLLPLLTDSSWQAKQAAIIGIRSLASQGPALRLWVPAFVPALLEIACHTRPEVSLWQWQIHGHHCRCVCCTFLDCLQRFPAFSLAAEFHSVLPLMPLDRTGSWPVKQSKHVCSLPLTIQNSSAALTAIAGRCAAHPYSMLCTLCLDGRHNPVPMWPQNAVKHHHGFAVGMHGSR